MHRVNGWTYESCGSVATVVLDSVETEITDHDRYDDEEEQDEPDQQQMLYIVRESIFRIVRDRDIRHLLLASDICLLRSLFNLIAL